MTAEDGRTEAMPTRATSPALAPTIALGGAARVGGSREAAQAILVRQTPPACADGEVHGLVALADGCPSSGRPELASSLALDAIEAGLEDPRAATVGQALTQGVQAAEHALRTRSLCAWDPHQLRSNASVAAFRMGYWSVLEAGSSQVLLLRGSSFGPVFPEPADTEPLGGGTAEPRATTFRAQPGDLILLASESLVRETPLRSVAEALRAAPHLAEGCRAVLDRLVGEAGHSAALAAVRLPDRPARSSFLAAALAAAALMFVLAALLGFLAWRSGPTRPVVPVAARETPPPPPNLYGASQADGKHTTKGGESQVPASIGAESSAAESRPARPATSAKGQVKIVGPSGTYAELVEDKPDGKRWQGQVRPGQGSFVFYGLPIPGKYRLDVWSSPSRTKRLRSSQAIQLGQAPAKFDVTPAPATKAHTDDAGAGPATTRKPPASGSTRTPSGASGGTQGRGTSSTPRTPTSGSPGGRAAERNR
jgi:hypothetical protein